MQRTEEELERRRVSNRGYYRRNKEKKLAANRAWRLRNPAHFAALLRRWSIENRDRRRIIGQRYVTNNAERVRAAGRAFSLRRRLDPERRGYARETGMLRTARTRANGGSFTRAEWRELVAVYAGRCAYCGAAVALEPDHIVPVAAGGSGDIDNIVPACRACNMRKNAKPMIVFLATRVA